MPATTSTVAAATTKTARTKYGTHEAHVPWQHDEGIALAAER